MKKNALILLEDGTSFHGRSVGVQGEVSGEIVVNTAMSGYQEVLTDPSYLGQIILFTTPHIGVVGVNREDAESSKISACGVIMKSLSSYPSNYRSEKDLKNYLLENNLIAIDLVDTRALTLYLRKKGIQTGTLIAKEGKDKRFSKDAHLKQTPSPHDLVEFHVALIDFGVKRSIIDTLHRHHCRVSVFSPKIAFEEILDQDVDGIVLSNGPKDPREFDLTLIYQLIALDIPIFGICLGHQLLALASGAKIKKMRCGHHSINHPVLDLQKNRVIISVQNHNYTIDETSLPPFMKVTHRSLFDQTIEGIRRLDKPFFGFQGHPEASAGPHDATNLFISFAEEMKKRRCLKETTLARF